MTRLAGLVRGTGCLVLVDELYSRLVYDGTPFHHLAAEKGMADSCITLLGPSKTESMSGFRVGVVVGPPDVMEGVEQTLAITSLRAPGYAQHLLAKWLVDDGDFLAERVKDLDALRKTTTRRLREVPGLKVYPQQGTAYLFPDVSALGVPDVEVAGALRREAGVIVSPGYQFGPLGIGHFRVCYARDEAEWDAALGRMVACLKRLGTGKGHGT
jgi:aspartate/methionine/tyrosine aminotransferase